MSPLLLLWGLHIVARERPHLVGSENFPVGNIFFPEGGDAACARSMDRFGHVACWNKATRVEVSVPPDIEQRYGPLYIRFGDDAGQVDFAVEDKTTSSSPLSFCGAFAAFSRDRRFLTLVPRIYRSDIRRWDLKTGKCLWTTSIERDNEGINYCQVEGLSPDGEMCAIKWGNRDSDGNGDSYLAVLDCRSGKVLARPPCFFFDLICFSPDSRTLVLWTEREMRCFDARTAKPLWHTTGSFLFGRMEPRFTPEGCVGVARPGGFDFLSARTGKLRRHLKVPLLGQMEAWNFSPDGKQLWWSNRAHEIFYRDLE